MGPASRVILLGASNLVRGVSIVAETIRLMVPGPVEWIIAMGHGRSYGTRSRILARTLPGIVECGLWETLTAAAPLPTYALVTDVGNDVAYGADLDDIERWVATCLDRLADAGARTIMTALPLASLEAMSRLRFAIARAILFPTRPITHEGAMARARELDERIRRLAAERGVVLVDQPAEWYGFDPIHIRYGRLPSAWAAIVAAWRPAGAGPVTARRSLARYLAIRRLTPQRWWLAGVRLGRRQPAARRRDGSSVWIF